MMECRFAVVLKRGGAAVDDTGSVPIEFKPAFEGGLYVVRSDASILGVNTGDCLHTIDLANVFRRPLSEVQRCLRLCSTCSAHVSAGAAVAPRTRWFFCPIGIAQRQC